MKKRDIRSQDRFWWGWFGCYANKSIESKRVSFNLVDHGDISRKFGDSDGISRDLDDFITRCDNSSKFGTYSNLADKQCLDSVNISSVCPKELL